MRTQVESIAAKYGATRVVVMLQLGWMGGCISGSTLDEPGQVSQYVVYGDDDRRELFELNDPALRTSLQGALAAIIPRRSLRMSGNGVAVEASTFAEKHGLCPGERFAEQPSAAMCSGVLVDWDLVLTAGHCLRVLPLSELVFVFGYYYAAPDELRIRAQDVIEPASIVDEALSLRGAPEQLDYGFVRLKHAVEAPLQPVPVHRHVEPVVDGEPLINAGTSGGVPLKVDQGASVIHARAGQLDFFVADADTSHGASGCGAFDRNGALLGVLARGGLDEEQRASDCSVTRVETAPSAAAEEFTYASVAVEALCARDPNASSLCRTNCEEPCRALSTSASRAGCSALPARSSSPWSSLAALFAILGWWSAAISRRAKRRLSC